MVSRPRSASRKPVLEPSSSTTLPPTRGAVEAMFRAYRCWLKAVRTVSRWRSVAIPALRPDPCCEARPGTVQALRLRRSFVDPTKRPDMRAFSSGRYWARTSDPQLVDATAGVTSASVLFGLVGSNRLVRRRLGAIRGERQQATERSLPHVQALHRHCDRSHYGEHGPGFNARTEGMAAGVMREDVTGRGSRRRPGSWLQSAVFSLLFMSDAAAHLQSGSPAAST